jgi:plastocyanin
MKLRATALWTALLLGGPGADAAAAPAVHTVVIEGMRFIPETLEVRPGDTVVWRNRDPFPHTATADAAGGPASPPIAAGATWSFKAAKRGRYSYLCTRHRTMKAQLVVR